MFGGDLYGDVLRSKYFFLLDDRPRRDQFFLTVGLQLEGFQSRLRGPSFNRILYHRPLRIAQDQLHANESDEHESETSNSRLHSVQHSAKP